MDFRKIIRTFWFWLLRYFSAASNKIRARSNETLSGQISINRNVTIYKPVNEVCATKECVFAANNLLSAMDKTVNPCENFYEYACGQWIRDHPIPNGSSEYDTFTAVSGKDEEQLKALLESNEKAKSRYPEMARILYQKCMSSKQIDMKELVRAFRELVKWPLLETNWNSSAFSITETLASLSTNGFGPPVLFDILIRTDPRNETGYGLQIMPASLWLTELKKHSNETERLERADNYEEYQLRVMKLLFNGTNVAYNESELKANVSDAVAFEFEIAKIQVTSEANNRTATPSSRRSTVADLYTLLPQVDWLKLFLRVAPESVHDIISNDTVVSVGDAEFMIKLFKLVDVTSRRTLANYIFWRTLNVWAMLLGEEFADILREMVPDMRPKQERWQHCMEVTSSLLPEAVAALFIHKHFDLESRKEALDMVANIREAFSDIVEESDCLDDGTKKLILQKVAALATIIGYDNATLSDTALDERNGKLNITSGNTYFEMLREVTICGTERLFLLLKKPANPTVIHAQGTEIVFPADIFKPPFFSVSYPKAVNYGAIGSFMAHEIFANSVLLHQLDKYGGWNNSRRNFENKMQCFIKQYNSYEVPNTGLKVNGNRTLFENIVDNGSITESFRAYRKYIERRESEEPQLPGMQNYTNDQVFFLSYAHAECSNRTEANLKKYILTDEHSPEVFRVNGVLANFPEFSRAFNCPPGSPLNPLERCSIW